MNGLASVTCIALRMRITSCQSAGSLVESMPNSGPTADGSMLKMAAAIDCQRAGIGFAGQCFERGDDARLAGRGEIETSRVAGGGRWSVEVVDQLGDPLRVAGDGRRCRHAGLGKLLAGGSKCRCAGEPQQAVGAEFIDYGGSLCVVELEVGELLQDRGREFRAIEIHQRQHRTEIVLRFGPRELERRERGGVGLRCKLFHGRCGFRRREGGILSENHRAASRECCCERNRKCDLSYHGANSHVASDAAKCFDPNVFASGRADGRLVPGRWSRSW